MKRTGRRSGTPTTRATLAPVAALLAVLALVGCGDGTPGYCEDLRSIRTLDGLSAALRADDLQAATVAADELGRVAAAAPPELAPSMQALSEGVTSVVELLQAQESNPAEYELRREQVQQQLGTLVDDAAVVSQWTEEQCGFRLLDGP